MSRKNPRGWQTGRSWRDKPVRERISAKHVLTAAGLDIRDIRSLPEIDQPPDCEAMIDGQWCGIEHTELVHEPTMKRSIRARRERQAGKDPKKPEAYCRPDGQLLQSFGQHFELLICAEFVE